MEQVFLWSRFFMERAFFMESAFLWSAGILAAFERAAFAVPDKILFLQSHELKLAAIYINY